MRAHTSAANPHASWAISFLVSRRPSLARRPAAADAVTRIKLPILRSTVVTATCGTSKLYRVSTSRLRGRLFTISACITKNVCVFLGNFIQNHSTYKYIGEFHTILSVKTIQMKTKQGLSSQSSRSRSISKRLPRLG